LAGQERAAAEAVVVVIRQLPMRLAGLGGLRMEQLIPRRGDHPPMAPVAVVVAVVAKAHSPVPLVRAAPVAFMAAAVAAAGLTLPQVMAGQVNRAS
jgi:hypothetical protein